MADSKVVVREICDLADKYNAMVFVDECHATGFFGKTGRGTEEYLDLKKNRVHIINSTLGKALGGAAGKFLELHIPGHFVFEYFSANSGVVKVVTRPDRKKL